MPHASVLPPDLSRGWTLVDCYATWCGPCRMLAPVLEQLASRYRGALTVAKVDVDRSPHVAQALGVSAMPTLVLFHDGREVGRTTGFRPLDQLAAWIEQSRRAA